ncbi:odorant receptor 13a-like [Frieseomelitta varia]|uniref:odorant receptor 13a-like n=1 Tax=Frieseomelitta varia TaxID=561572 RepID=UPI001CB68A61|nr:odorant receptor 13a-like [Frieseomelitta varia]
MRTVIGKLAIMDIQRDLNYQYGWNRSIMKYIGIWPEERKWNRPSSYVVLIPFLTMLCFVYAPQTINLPFIIHDLNLVVENLSMVTITFTISLMKIMTFWMNGKSLKSLLKCIAKDWATVKTKTERETMVNIARVTRMIMIGCSMMCQLVVACYVILRLIFMEYDDNKMFVRGYYPYDITVSPNYELTMIGQAIAGAYSASIYSSVDSFVAMLILHACGQISNLKNDLREIHSNDKIDLQTKLKKIVEKHNYINRFAETIENCFNLMLLFQMLGCIIQLCFQCFQAIMSLGEEAEQFMVFQIAFLCFYVTCAMMQLYLYCYVGERLTFESTDVANTAYNCQWYSLPPKDARLFIIIMCRARSSPLMITAGKFCWFTILLYSQVLKTSMSYISVLYAMQS